MKGSLQDLVLDPAGPLGLREEFFLNAVVEIGGFVLGALVFSILVPLIIETRQSVRWRPARQNLGQELMLLHLEFGDALSRFLNSPEGPSRVRAAGAVDHAFRAIPAMTGLFGYALTAAISREVNDYIRSLRAIRDWAHVAAHPEDIVFASAERRVPQSRDMFARANREFADVVSVLGLAFTPDVCWPRDLEDGLAGAYDASQLGRADAG
jgi:hypothetical protein